MCNLSGEDPDADYNAVIECIIEDLESMIEVLVQNDPYRYVKMPDLLREWSTRLSYSKVE